ncbi:MAG: flagellar hook protein FlgE [Pseudomonadota bacterium]
MPFRIALSGINAASSDLAVTANNIANANTYGFKGSRAEFSEVFATGSNTLSSNASGSGVKLSQVSQLFSQGNVDFTNNNLDLAIGGEGFFVTADNNGRNYTRAGNFSVDREGFIVGSQNDRLQVYPVNDDGTFNTGRLTDMQLSVGASPPNATTTIDIGVNLPAEATTPANPVFDPTDSESYTHSTSTTIYDSLGASHTVTVYYVKTAVDNVWDSHMYIDNNAVGGAEQLTFGTDGLLQDPPGGQITMAPYDPGNGAAVLNLTSGYADATQFGNQFAVNELMQDGFATGRLSGIDVAPDGTIFARFTNGQSQPLGQVAVANFPNPQGLQQVGETAWRETFTSGDVLLGEAGGASFGLIQAGALEASNVDLTAQLVNMITAQRNFQANAQMISTADTVTQTVINIR